MAIPPRPTERNPADWEVTGEHPTRSARRSTPDRAGPALVGLALVAALVAPVPLFVL